MAAGQPPPDETVPDKIRPPGTAGTGATRRCGDTPRGVGSPASNCAAGPVVLRCSTRAAGSGRRPEDLHQLRTVRAVRAAAVVPQQGGVEGLPLPTRPEPAVRDEE